LGAVQPLLLILLARGQKAVIGGQNGCFPKVGQRIQEDAGQLSFLWTETGQISRFQ
jgi:hypothetical protein